MRPTSASRRPEERACSTGLRPRFAGLAGAFALAAVAVALVRSRQALDHGWWLVAYLALVGGLSQLIFGAGKFALGAASAGRRVLAGELVFWNLGAVLVPVGVFAGAPGVVAVGSAVLNATLRRAHDAGIDLDAVTSELEREGVRSFCDSYHELLDCIETKLKPTLAISEVAPADGDGS